MGIQSKNQTGWFLTHIANLFNSVTTVSFYDTLGPEATRFCVQQTQLTTLACTHDCAKNLAQMKKDDKDGEMVTLQNIMIFGLTDGTVPTDVKDLCQQAGLTIHKVDDVLRKGREVKSSGTVAPGREPLTDDVLMLSYTSGTTGMPKGV